MVLAAVPARIGGRIAQAEIGGEIDHLDLRRLAGRFCDHRLGGGMGQRAEHEIEARPIDLIDGDELRQREAGENCANTSRISWPARRSAVRSAISTSGWRSSRRTHSEPV